MTDKIRENKRIADEKFNELVNYCTLSGQIDLNLYTEYDVKRGLRDSNGKGVLTGLTEISDVVATDMIDGKKIPAEGRLYYQGYNVYDLIAGLPYDNHFGFEETTYLLLFGALPTFEQLEEFKEMLGHYRELPETFVRDVIMSAPSANMMNALQKCVISLYSYDDKPDDVTIPNILRQSLQLIAQMPMISVYCYHAYRHYHLGKNLVIRNPKPELSTAENILRMLRSDGKYTPLEAKVLDVALILHAEHGGGNNSTFSTHVVSSTGTDTYSAIAASLGSLKGPKHGGANLKVQEMFDDIKAHVTDWENEAAIEDYLMKILNKEAFDHAGLIYGMGHAVYTLSDPREVILKRYAKKLSEERDNLKEFEFYDRVERLAIKCIQHKRHLFKPLCANVDFYSGLVYTMLGLPRELYTPIFAIARISGWSAHRIEEMVSGGKIIRPAYKYVGHHVPYNKIEMRKE
jgi:citrate synthase